jgi:small conductance mechanosensitive channel
VLLQAPAEEELAAACGDEPGVVCRNVLEWTDSEGLAKAANFLVDRPLRITLILLVAFVINRLVRRGIRRFVDGITGEVAGRRLRAIGRRAPSALRPTSEVPTLRAAARARTIAAVLRSLATGVIYSLAAMTVLAELGIELAPLIAGAGIVGVALGFGAQSLVKDFLSGIFMLIEDQYGVGDIVDLGMGDVLGTVEAVSLRATRVRDVNGTVWHVPNGEIRRVGNKSQQWARAVLDVAVATGTDLRRAQEVIKRVADEVWADPAYADVILEEPEVWGVEGIGADGMLVRLVVKTLPSEQFKVSRELRLRLKEAFDEEGISLPAPQGALWMPGKEEQ